MVKQITLERQVRVLPSRILIFQKILPQQTRSRNLRGRKNAENFLSFVRNEHFLSFVRQSEFLARVCLPKSILDFG